MSNYNFYIDKSISNVDKSISWVYNPNNTSIWTSSTDTDDTQMSLFEHKDVAELKVDADLFSQTCGDLSTISNVLCNAYKKMWPSMHLYFYSVQESRKVLQHKLYSLPYLFFEVHKNNKNTLVLRSHFQGYKFDRHSWHNIPDCDEPRDVNKFLRTDVSYFCHDVKSVKAYNWGFQIITQNNHNCICVHTKTVADNDDQYSRCDDWSVPFVSSLREEENMKKVIAEYQVERKEA